MQPIPPHPPVSTGTRHRRRAAAALATVWVFLAVVCLGLVGSASNLRRDVDRRADWVSRAQSLRARIGRTPAALPEGELTPSPVAAVMPIDSSLRLELESADLLRAAPLAEAQLDPCLRRWTPVADSFLTVTDATPHLDGLGGQVEIALLQAQLASQLASVLDLALSEVRVDIQGVRERLDRHYTLLFVVATLCLISAGAFFLFLIGYRRQAEALESYRVLLEERRHRFELLVQRSRDLIWATDVEGRWTFVNDAARHLYGLEPERMLGRPLADFVPKEQARRDRAALSGVVSTREPAEFDTVVLNADGDPTHVRFHAAPALDGAGRLIGITGTASDLTREREMQERMRHNQRLQALGTLAGGVAHDFNNLLTAIVGYTELAKADVADAERCRSTLGELTNAAMRGRNLTEQLLAFARRKPLVRTVANLGRILEYVHGLVRRVIPEDVCIETRVLDEGLWSRVDAGQLEQVILNLAVNARDAISGEGNVGISLRLAEVNDEKAGTLGIQAGSWAVIAVADDGQGMDATTLTRAFDPFFTTKEPGKGTGLGLATVHGIIHQHGGTMEVRSQVGRGTTFYMYLPLVPAPAVPEELMAPEPAVAPRTKASGSRCVLVVEDDPIVRVSVERGLVTAGYDVLSAENAHTALIEAETAGREVEALITDVRMPGMSGPELVARMRHRRPDLPVLFISGYMAEELAAQWHDAEGVRFLPKPFTQAQLLAVLGELVPDVDGVADGAVEDDEATEPEPVAITAEV